MSEKEIKEEITSTNIKIEDNIEILKKYFSSCFDKNGNFNLEKFQKEISKSEINLSKESYGLEWLGKSYARVRTFDPTRTLLKENEKWNQKDKNKNSKNVLIKGDNLEVLKHLSNAYYEKIKMIYIDPPYNTGKDDFVYSDDRKFTIDEFMELAGVDEERAKRVLEFVDSKSNSHSAWLTFMYPRLYIAKKLLKDDGVIFVSIDDNEVAQLRLLMDEIFGEENFEGLITWRRRHNQPNDKTKIIAIVSEYILVYSKNKEKLKQAKTFYSFPLSEKRKKSYKNPDNDPRGLWDTTPWKAATNQGGTKYKIVTPTGKEYINTWMGNEETFKKLLDDNRIIFTNNGNGLPRKKIFWEERLLNGQPAHNFWNHSEFGSNQEGSSELDNLFLIKGIFTNPKPTKLIKRILTLTTQNNDIILDFFAGSGTTGDAVMQLNSEDGGNRKFILVQLPEKINPNKTAYEFVKQELKIETPTIFDITKERLIRAGKKIEENLTTQNLDTGFKIFETTPLWEDYLLDEKELQKETRVFNRILTDEELKSLFITWKTNDGISLTENYQEIKINNYLAYYVGNILYLMKGNFSKNEIKTLLEKIDNDKNFVIDKIIAFGYNFTSINLREIYENIKNYSNKKNIEIETIIRF